MHRILAFMGLLAVVPAVVAAPITLEMASPLSRSSKAADLDQTPRGAIPLSVGALSSMWNAISVRLNGMPMPDGSEATLVLERRDSPIESTWLIGSDTAGNEIRRHVPAAPVLLLAGTVDGDPGSAVFLGLAEGQAQGWIETEDGLHLITTSPDGGPTLMYRVGADRGGIDVPPPAPIRNLGPPATAGQKARFVPTTDVGRLLMELEDPDSRVRKRFLEAGGADKIPDLLNLVGADSDLAFGACCIFPGFCMQLPAVDCASFCDDSGDPMFEFCDVDIDTPATWPDCWLGPDVRCDEQWVCFDSVENDPGPDDDDYPWLNNWIGACCFPDPDNPGETLFEDRMACECAMLGGRFVAAPSICIGDFAPEEMPTNNFLTVADLEELVEPGVDFCNLPAGACCIEQNVFCAYILEDADEVIQEMFEQPGCVFIPQVMCEDVTIISGDPDDPADPPGVFNGTGGAGVFLKECFPCTYDTNTADDSFICAIDAPDNEVTPLAPRGVRCQTPRIILDTDTWYLERFNGDLGAAQAYAIMLMGATTYIYDRDALVSLQIGELLLRVDGDITQNADYYPSPDDVWTEGDPEYVNPYLPGACCVPVSATEFACWEDLSYLSCLDRPSIGSNVPRWQGPGSSCYEASGDCAGTPVNIFEPTVWTVADTRDNMVYEWYQGAASRLDFGFDMVLLLSGFSYEGDAGIYDGSPWGVVPEGVAAGTGASLCTTVGSPFAVASINGKFPYPGASFDADDVGWDVVTTSQGIALTLGVLNTWVYGYDYCAGPRCDAGLDATLDCDFERALGATGLQSMPATLMSHCYRCEGGASNIQLRFRSEIAARIYARLANLDCAADGSTTAGPYEVEVDVEDPNNPGETITVTVMMPIAANDILRVYGEAGQILDVLANDVAGGCNAASDGALVITTVNGSSDPTGVVTAQGGTVTIDPEGGFVLYDPPPGGVCGIDFFEYTIEIDDPDGALITDPVATVWLIHQPKGGNVTIEPVPWIDCMPGACCIPDDAGECVDLTEAQCVASGGNWQGDGTACGDVGIPCPPAFGVNSCLDPAAQGTWPASYNEPPFAATPPSLPVGECRLDTLQVEVDNPGSAIIAISWDGVMAQIVNTAVTQPEELLLRFWFATVPGGLPDDFVDVRPFADPGLTTDCGPSIATAYNPVTGIAGPSAGLCVLDLPRYVPTENGVSAIPVQLLVDFDEVPGADACWIGGSLSVFRDDNGGFGEIDSIGACCVGGLCIETNPFQCAALSGYYGSPPAPYGETYWASGFFAGSGTTCDEADWCRPTAPCCYESVSGDRSCEALTADDCYTVGEALGNDAADYAVTWGTIGWDMGFYVDATTLDGDEVDPDPSHEPAWDLVCDFPVCNTDPYLATIAACCVRTDDDTFCTDLTEEACDEYAAATGWMTSWSIRGKCQQVPCSEYGGVSWQAPLGACCIWYLDPYGTADECVDNVTFDECMDTYLTPSPLSDPSVPQSQVIFQQGLTCVEAACEDAVSPVGACCMSLDSFCCLPDFDREICNLFGGTWLGMDSDCTGCVPQTVQTPGVCCLQGMACTTDLNLARCAAAGGTWHAQFTSCREGLPCYGVTSSVGSGACCFEYECVDATTPGLQDINKVDCLLGGGRWLGIGLCNGASPTFPPKACDPVVCDGVLSGHIATTFDDATCTDFGGVPQVPLGDVNGDGHVGGLPDLIPMIEQWGQPSPNADLDASGEVGIPDLLILLTLWE